MIKTVTTQTCDRCGEVIPEGILFWKFHETKYKIYTRNAESKEHKHIEFDLCNNCAKMLKIFLNQGLAENGSI